MDSKRSYNDACAAAHALDLIGERWALLVVRELMLGPKRFTDLRSDLPQISPNVLSQRLKDLEDYGVVYKKTLPPPAASQVYELTEWGLDLEPVLVQLGRWAVRSPFKPDAALSLTSFILSLRTMFNPEAAAGLKATYNLKLGDYLFAARVENSSFSIEPGQASAPDVSVETDHLTLAGLVYGGQDIGAALAAGTLQLEGDEQTLERFVELFPLPEPVT